MLAFLSSYSMFACATVGTIFCDSICKSVAGATDKKNKFARRNDFGFVALSERLTG